MASDLFIIKNQEYPIKIKEVAQATSLIHTFKLRLLKHKQI
jgi:hypothetical protein